MIERDKIQEVLKEYDLKKTKLGMIASHSALDVCDGAAEEGFETLVIFVMAVTLIAAIFIFRPFCYLLCPIGLFTWILEHISLAKIRLNEEKCTECNVCIDKSPCPAVPAIMEGKRSRPDCHACGACQEVCPVDALKFR